MRERMSFPGWLVNAAVSLVLAGSVLLYYSPLLEDPTQLAPDSYDGAFVSWVLQTEAKKLADLELSTYFDGRIYWPHERTIAFSDPFITSSLLSLPIYLVTKSGVDQHVFAQLVAQYLLLQSLYWLLCEVTGRRGAALGMSLLFGYSTLRLLYLVHLQMMELSMVVLGLLAIERLLKTHDGRWLWLFWGCLVFQTLNSFFAGMMLFLPSIVWVVFNRQTRHLIWKSRSFWLGGLLSAGVILPVAWQYVQVSRTYDYSRPLTEVIHFSLSPEMLARQYLSPGLYLAILMALGWWVWRRTNRESVANRYLATGMAALVMSLGPALHWMGQTVKIPFHVPLPYLAFFYLVPGFGGFRTPSRWIVLAGMLFTVFAARVIGRQRRQVWLVTILVCLGLGAWTMPAMPVASIDMDLNAPEYLVLGTMPERPLIELPIHSWGSGEASRQEVWRMLAQGTHGQPLVNGYSGFAPPEWEAMVAEQTRTFPSREAVEALQDYGVGYVLVHLDELEADEDAVREAFDAEPVWGGEASLVYEL